MESLIIRVLSLLVRDWNCHAGTFPLRDSVWLKIVDSWLTTLFRIEDFEVTNIYVGNLSFRATEDDLRGAFSPHGEVSSVNIIMDRETGRSRGFAFVEMPNPEDAQAAIEALNGQEIAGRGVTVNEARPREDRPRGGGGGGRYGGDRGRSFSRDDR